MIVLFARNGVTTLGSLPTLGPLIEFPAKPRPVRPAAHQVA